MKNNNTTYEQLQLLLPGPQGWEYPTLDLNLVSKSESLLTTEEEADKDYEEDKKPGIKARKPDDH